MGWKLNLGILAGAGIAIAAVATIFQKQISNAAFTTGQTFGQIPVRLAEGILEPFQTFFKTVQNPLTNTGIGDTPSATAPIAVTPVSPIPPPPGQAPPVGAPGNDPNNSSNTPPPGGGNNYHIYIGGGTPPATPTTPGTPTTPPKQDTPPPKTNYQITINAGTKTGYTEFLDQLVRATGQTSNEFVKLAKQAYALLQQGTPVITIPGLPTINVAPIRVIPAFGETPPKSTPNKVSTNDKTALGMGAVSMKPVNTSPVTQVPGTYYSPAKVAVPTAKNPNQAQIDTFAQLFKKQAQKA